MYIQSAAQISSQQPLSEAWFDTPILHDTVYVRAIEPNYKDYLEPNMARRMGKILKRAIVTARTAVQQSGGAMPDAIISATGLGCIESTEIFLEAMIRDGEELLPPTHFMQSTHNTISSQISIDMKCRGYNSTYMQKGVSFENALLDAYLQLSAGRLKTALVGGYDELTPHYQIILSRLGYWRANGENVRLQRGEEAFASETSVSFMLSAEKNADSICQINNLDILYKPSIETLQSALNELLRKENLSIHDIDVVMTGMSGHKANDDVYRSIVPHLFGDKTLAVYKPVFGESYTASAIGLYVAATCLHKQRIPDYMLLDKNRVNTPVKTILFYNQYENKNHAFTLLTKC